MLIKQPGGIFRPANESDAEQCTKIRNGIVTATIKQPRNPQFHAKFFALLNFTFDYWEPIEEYKGRKVDKNFTRFRKDLTVLAGFYDVVANIKGEVRYEAKSISFGTMEEEEFNDVYRAVFRQCWDLVLSKVTGMTEEEAERCINEMMSFA